VAVLDVARARQDRLIKLNRTVTTRSLSLWRRGMTADFDASYGLIESDLNRQVQVGQLRAAEGATRTAARFASEYGLGGSGDAVVPQSFVGIDGSGRELGTLLYGAVTTAKTAVGAGLGTTRALETGAAYLAAMIKTAMADLGRSSDLTAATSRRFAEYVRLVSPGACSRCAILAGKSSYKVAFKRHPACKCTAAPVPDGESAPTGFHATPDAYFASLSPAEQDRVFTKAGAEAIRAGADPVSVASARRGATGISWSTRGTTVPNSRRRLERTRIGTKPDGSPILGYVTNEGNTVRGAFGKQQVAAGTGTVKVGTRYSTVKRTRLMPETIVGLTDDIETRRVLLRDAGYLERPIRDTSNNKWIAEREAGIREDRERADAFYRSLGVTL